MRRALLLGAGILACATAATEAPGSSPPASARRKPKPIVPPSRGYPGSGDAPLKLLIATPFGMTTASARTSAGRAAPPTRGPRRRPSISRP